MFSNKDKNAKYAKSYKEKHPEHYKEITRKASLKWKQTNIEYVRERDRNQKQNKRNFINEWKILRNIDLFEN